MAKVLPRGYPILLRELSYKHWGWQMIGVQSFKVHAVCKTHHAIS